MHGSASAIRELADRLATAEQRIQALEGNHPAIPDSSPAPAGGLVEQSFVPPHELVHKWFEKARALPSTPFGITHRVAKWAAQWGAAQAITQADMLRDVVNRHD